MQISNVKYYRDLPFEDYLSMHGTSFSSLKNDIPQSNGMMLGTRVHNYLNTPGVYDWVDVEIVKSIAGALRAYVGEAFKYLEKETAFTAFFEHNDMRLLYKGRADMLRIGKVIVDIKVLSGGLQSAIERFGYENQISGYCLATGARLGIIISYNKATKKVEVKTIKPSTQFWAYQVVCHGKPILK